MPRVTIQPRVSPDVTRNLGQGPNAIRRLDDGRFMVVASSTNSISVWSKEGVFEQTYELGPDNGPYDAAQVGDDVWVTNFVSQSVSVVNLASGEVEKLQDESLDDPSGIAMFGDTVVVSNVAFEATGQPYGDGSFTVFDAATREVVTVWDAAAKNPLFVRPVGIGGAETLVTTSSGDLLLQGGGAQVASEGAVQIWRSATEEPTTYTMPQVADPQIGAPGRPLVAPNGQLYFASGTAPVLFAVDPDVGWVHGSDDPLRFAESGGDSLHHADIARNGVILVTSFNDDGLYLWDTTCDRPMHTEPLDLGDTSLLEGPHGVLVTSDSDQETIAHFVTSVSNSLGRIVLQW